MSRSAQELDRLRAERRRSKDRLDARTHRRGETLARARLYFTNLLRLTLTLTKKHEIHALKPQISTHEAPLGDRKTSILVEQPLLYCLSTGGPFFLPVYYS